MKFSIIIPAHNESRYIGQTLDSLIKQSVTPHEVIVVNDNSSDNTGEIIASYVKKHPFISLVNRESSDIHMPGSKIIHAFNHGLKVSKKDYDYICKFDADLIFPVNYLETLTAHFKNKPRLGMVAGFCFIEKNGTWKLENLTRKDHIRGALKCYKKACFEAIGGLKPAMGWDTVDELLASYYGWELLTDETLEVKHLKPTGETYNKQAKLLQGEAMYRMRYGFVITVISAIKLSLRKKNLRLFVDYINGYLKAPLKTSEFLVTEEQGKYIRSIRWKGIRQKLF